MVCFVAPVLARCVKDGIKIIGNFGAANPAAAAARIQAMAYAQALPAPRIGVIDGDDLTALLSPAELAARETGGAILRNATEIIAANLYLGAEPIAQALDQGADIVVTGRVADSALALGPLIHAFRWKLDDWDRLAAGTLAGHLLECGSQITGGYFADPPSRSCRAWLTWAIRSPRSIPTAAWSSPSPRQPAVGSIDLPSLSNCCTKFTIPRPI